MTLNILSIILCLSLIHIGASIEDNVISFRVQTDLSANGNLTQLNLELFWNTRHYNCTLSITPSSTNTWHSCNTSTSSLITPNAAIPYYLRLHYLSSYALPISIIEITDSAFAVFTINSFCIR